MNQLREAIQKQKNGMIHQLIKNGVISSQDVQVKHLTLTELEWMLKQLKEPKRNI